LAFISADDMNTLVTTGPIIQSRKKLRIFERFVTVAAGETLRVPPASGGTETQQAVNDPKRATERHEDNANYHWCIAKTLGV
jgi:hypothetical protein